MDKPNQEICSIRIMFPVTSDEEAIACKKKIQEVLNDKPDVNIQFNISPMPAQMPMR